MDDAGISLVSAPTIAGVTLGIVLVVALVVNVGITDVRVTDVAVALDVFRSGKDLLGVALAGTDVVLGVEGTEVNVGLGVTLGGTGVGD